MTQPVDGRGIDPVDAAIERAAYRGNRCVIIQGPPAGRPFRATDSPGAKPDTGDRHIGHPQTMLRQAGPVGSLRLSRRHQLPLSERLNAGDASIRTQPQAEATDKSDSHLQMSVAVAITQGKKSVSAA